MDFQYILIAIAIILAIVLLYFGFTRFIKNKNLNQDSVSTIDCQRLLVALGGKDNILDVKSSPSKVTVSLKNQDNINIEDIKALGASGIVEGSQNLSMIFGKQSPSIEEDLKKLVS